jgi:hypothetical protein
VADRLAEAVENLSRTAAWYVGRGQNLKHITDLRLVLAALHEATGRMEVAEADADRLAAALRKHLSPSITPGAVADALAAHDRLVAGQRGSDAT